MDTLHDIDGRRQVLASKGEAYRLPFGKHKGTPLSAVPSDYLTWLSTKVDTLREPLRSHLIGELARRASVSATPTPTTTTREDTMCAVCGLGGTTERPLVHEACTREVPPF